MNDTTSQTPGAAVVVVQAFRNLSNIPILHSKWKILLKNNAENPTVKQ